MLSSSRIKSAAMPPLVNQPTNRPVSEWIDSIDNKSKQEDARILLKLLEEVTGHKPVVWGDNFIIGFGRYTYTRKNSKEEHQWFHVGFAPRKTRLTVYLTYDINPHANLTELLGKATWGKGCLHINKLADVNLEVLRKMVELSKDARWH